MGWNGTNLKSTWLRKQGGGMGKGPNLAKEFYCDMCKRNHGKNVDGIIVDGLTMCFRQYYKYLDAKKNQ